MEEKNIFFIWSVLNIPQSEWLNLNGKHTERDETRRGGGANLNSKVAHLDFFPAKNKEFDAFCAHSKSFFCRA